MVVAPPASPVVIAIEPQGRPRVRFVRVPSLTSRHPWVARGIGLLQRYLPRVLDYLSRQHALTLLRSHPVTVLLDPLETEMLARRLLTRWLAGKTQRRLLYLVVGIPVVVASWIAAFLPGPNVVGYFISILYYFHLRSFLSLLRTRVERMALTFAPDPTGPARVDKESTGSL